MMVVSPVQADILGNWIGELFVADRCWRKMSGLETAKDWHGSETENDEKDSILYDEWKTVLNW